MQKIKRQIQLQLNVRECVSVLKPEHDVAIFSLRNIFLVVMSS